MTEPIFFIGGSKGGVGKSVVSGALIDYLKTQNIDPLLVESDTSNPDVWKTYQESTKAHLLDLDKVDGWMALVDMAESNPEQPFVISTASRNNIGVSKFGSTLNAAMGELNRKLIVLWVIDRNRDSLELLLDFREVMTDATVHVVRNGHWGEAQQFELYEDSNLRKSIEATGGKSVLFPGLADRVADRLKNQRMPIEVAAKELPLGNRMELLRWRGEAKKVFDEIIA
jgi:hypothetical protein